MFRCFDVVKNCTIYLKTNVLFFLDLHEPLEWPFPHQIDDSIGQISGVSVSKDNLVHIFHRGDREWNQTTFLYTNVYRDKSKGPIIDHVVVVLDPKNGSVINRWGSNRYSVFFLNNQLLSSLMCIL